MRCRGLGGFAVVYVLFYFQRATETLLCGKSALVCGYGEVGKGVVSALKSLGCILFVSEADPICALQVGNVELKRDLVFPIRL